jgi:hypothetical protein
MGPPERPELAQAIYILPLYTVFPFPKSQSWAKSATIRHIRQGMYRSTLSMINYRQVDKSGGLGGISLSRSTL